VRPRWKFQAKFNGEAKDRSMFHMVYSIHGIQRSRCGARSLLWGGMRGKKSDYSSHLFCKKCLKGGE
jgi:hypothetical protein